MKFSLFMMVVCLQVSAAGVAQTISITERKASLENIFEEINKQTGYEFLYNARIVSKANPVDIDVKDASLDQVLRICFSGQLLTYVISEKTIVVKEAVSDSVNGDKGESSIIEIKGIVKSKNGDTMPGVNVFVKSSSNGTTTDNNGNFSIVANENDVLVFSFIGFKTKEVLIGNQSTLDIILEEDVLALGEVVISGGYYETTDKTKTGNITRVSSKEIEGQPVTSPLMALQGRVPGLQITAFNGTPGSAPNIRIRGNNSLRTALRPGDPNGNRPLYVIDGVQINSDPLISVSSSFMEYGFDPLTSISPDNIEDIQVLKDGDATAIYGSRGANGVILITTKKAKTTSETNVSFNVYRGVGQVSNVLQELNKKQYLEMRHESFRNDEITPTRANAYDLLIWDTTRYTNWQKILLGGTANITDIQGSLAGGNGTTSFRLAGGLHKETMVLPGDFWFTRGNLSLSVSHLSSNKKFRAVLSSNFGISKNKLFDDSNFVNSALTLPPIAPKLSDASGNVNWEVDSITQLSTFSRNPLAKMMKGNESRAINVVVNASLSYEIIPDLILKSSIGITELNSREFSKQPLSSLSPEEQRNFPRAYSFFGTNSRQSWIVEPQLSYSKSLNKHAIETLAGLSFQENINSFSKATGTYLNDNFLESLEAAVNVDYTVDDNSFYRYSSGFARIGYSYDEKYFLNVTGRRDGSSRFGPGNKFGNFWSIGGAWIFSEENLIKKNLTFLSFGKIRASYGLTGSDNIGDYKFYDLYSSKASYNNIPALFPDALFNPNFAWEQTAKVELALQLGFLQDRITIEGSFYRNRSSNQLVDYPVPATTGFPSMLRNFNATIENKGLEVALITIPFTVDNFKWTSSLNITFSRNRLVKFDGIEDSPYAPRYKVGRSLSIQRLYKWTGVDPVTGYDTFLDVNNDGNYDEADKVFTRSFDPTFFGGIINSFRFKRFELSFLLQFSKQRGVRYLGGIPGTANNQPSYVLDRWQNEGDMTNISKYSQTTSGSGHAPYSTLFGSDGIIEDASFLRMKTLSISYQLPKKMLQRVKIQESRIYIQGQNLFTITRLRNLDPESGSALPPLRIVTMGIDIKF